MTVDLNLATLEQITDELVKRYPHGVVVVGLTLLGSIEVQTRAPHIFSLLGALDCTAASMRAAIAQEMNQNRGKDGSGN